VREKAGDLFAKVIVRAIEVILISALLYVALIPILNALLIPLTFCLGESDLLQSLQEFLGGAQLFRLICGLVVIDLVFYKLDLPSFRKKWQSQFATVPEGQIG